MSSRPPRSPGRAGLAIGGGLLVGLALPPWGLWPLAFVGIAAFELALGGDPTGRQRAARGWLFAAAWLFPGMCWMWFLTAPGYLAAVTIYAGYHAVAALVAPRGPWRVIGRPAAHTLAEALRFSFPFGGVPLASLPIGQAGGPFLSVVRVGGALLLTWLVFQVGFAIGHLATAVGAVAAGRGHRGDRRGPRRQRERLGLVHAGIGLLGALAVVAIAGIAPTGRPGADAPTKRVTIVQGGGPQGTHAAEQPEGSEAEVFARHLAATRMITSGSTDLVVWPENVITDSPFAGSAQFGAIAEQATRVGAPFAVGITEDLPSDRFLNSQVVVASDGTIAARYDKVRRVPFGEYMPLRSLLKAVGAPTDLVPRNAVAGTRPALLDLPDGTRVGVVISWEVFFGGRANEGIARGGTFILNPTNGSSYTWTVLQTQQVASSRLRAVEQGRWVVQASPTGFSAFVTPTGEVLDRTAISEQRVLTRTVDESTRRTWYSHLGNPPFIALAALVLAGAWLATRLVITRRRSP